MSTSKLGNATGEIGYQAAADYLTRLKGRLDLGWSASFTRYGLGRDLRTEFKNPVAKIPISVRSLREEDLSALFSYDAERDPVGKSFSVGEKPLSKRAPIADSLQSTNGIIRPATCNGSLALLITNSFGISADFPY